MLRASGQTGTTYDLSNVGISEELADKYQPVWFPADAQPTMAEAFAKTVDLQALGVVKHPKSGLLGVRTLRNSPQAKAAAIAIEGTDAVLAQTRYRITGIEAKCATTGQITKVLATLAWDAKVYHSAWDPATSSYFALARAHQAPKNTTVKVAQCAIPWTITEAPIEEVKPKVQTFHIVDPTAIREPKATAADAGGATDAPATLQAKAARSPHLHDIMHAAAPTGKGHHHGTASRSKSNDPPPPSANGP